MRIKWRTKLRPRLLPVVAVAAATLLGLKVADLLTNGLGTMAPPAHAQAPNTPPPAAAPAPTPPSAPAKTAAAPATPTPRAPATNDTAVDPQSLSPAEIEVLQQLSQRRAALDQRASELDQREVLLQAAEKRINEKIAKLEELQKTIAGDVQKQNAEDDAHLKSLVKIYEVMKPKDAAQILEQLDMRVLLSVLERMKELKTAPILAAMDPSRAKAVTTALAERRNRTDATQGSSPPPSPKS